MLDRDLAMLYEIGTKVLNQAVKRNARRFPEDFMFRLTRQEYEDLRFQFETSNNDYSLRSQIVTLKNSRAGILNTCLLYLPNRALPCLVVL